MSAQAARHVVPSDGERGLASYPLDELAALVLPAWDAFLELAAATDLDADSRVPGWTARDVCLHLGSWPGSRTPERMLAEARAGDQTGTFDQDAHNDAVIEAHRDASRDEVLAGLARSRAGAADLLASPEVAELGQREIRSVLGPLPLLSLVAAGCYELAVHAADLATADAPPAPPELTQAGVASLVDVTGALAARCDLDTIAACVTPEGGWAFACQGADWTTMRLPDVRTGWPSVEAPAHLLLDASAGRRHVPVLLARREMRLHHVQGLLALAPIVETVPGLPGASALTGALRHLRGVGRLVRRLPGVPG